MTERGELMWRDKLVKDLTREEAIDALRYCMAITEAQYSSQMRTFDAWKHCRDARRS